MCPKREYEVSQNPISFVQQRSKQRICTRKYIKQRCSHSHQQGHVKPHRENQASKKQNFCPTHAITSVCEKESDPKDSSEHLSLIY